MFDGKAFGQEVVEIVKTYVGRMLQPIETRLASIETRALEPGEPGPKGRDGIGVAGATINRDGDLMLTLSNGDLLNLGHVNGKDGADGLGFDDLEVTHDGERTFTIRLARDDRCREFSFSLPVLIYRGAWAAGTYQRGDTVTWGGSLWHCDAMTEDRPDDGSTVWTRAVRRGRDGKNGEKGDKGDPGIQGRAGRDLTQMAPDGAKW